MKIVFPLLLISCIAENKPLKTENKNPVGIIILENNSYEALSPYLSKNIDKVFNTITFNRLHFEKTL
ncbi:hypothetical protein [Flavobacterium sp. UBA4854]|uniref:hypothetical protein n=1 Tax=Flavobacterium sp. UBA4854 TaxID=1946548 RepID=UPI00257CAC17|nr:hypothetical protein [Flavobacterium sp. UBA4854]